MNKLLTFILFLSFCGCGFDENLEQAIQASFSRIVAKGDHPAATHSYIVMFKTPRTTAFLPKASFLQEAKFHYAYLDRIWRFHPEVASIRYIDQVDLRNVVVPGAKHEFFRSQFVRSFSGDEIPPQNTAIAQVDFDSEEASEEILKNWERLGLIWSAEPNYLSELSQQNTFSQTIKDYEGAFSNSWLQTIQLDKAFATLASNGVADADIGSPVIAVLDSGVDVNHAQLKSRIWENPSPGGADCGSQDVNGCDTTKAEKGTLGVGDVSPFGWDGTSCPGSGRADAPDNCAHGTHVAGIIVASAENGLGGVCPVCRVMPVKIISGPSAAEGQATDAAILNGIKYVKTFISNSSNKSLVRVINASFGKFVKSRAVSVVVSVLAQSPFNVLIVGAAGNEDTMKRAYPAALDDVIAVSAIQQSTGEKAKFSNFGPWVDIAAPGVGIDSTVPAGTGQKSGTSMAAPIVSGVAGLILSVNPNMSGSQVKSILLKTSDFNALYPSDDDSNRNFSFYYPSIPGENVRRPLLGAGLLNADAAIIGTSKTGQSFNALNRVEPGCGRVGGTSGTISLIALLFGLVGPVVLRRMSCSG